MGLFGLFGGSKSKVEVDNSRNDGNKKRMRELFLEVSPDLSQAGEPYTYKPQDVKRVNFIKMTGAYYLQYGNSFKKEFFNFFVPKYVDEILNNDWYDEETFAYVDQRDEHSSWVEFWNHFCRGR